MIAAYSETAGGVFTAMSVSFIILSGLIIIHEAGHYLAARHVGINVIEFGLGYPPRIIGRMWRGTLFSLNIIPFGGFARMLGEGRESDLPGSFASKSLSSRAFVLIAGPIMNLLAAPLLFAGAAMIADIDGVQVVRIEMESPAEAAGIQVGDIIREIDGVAVPLPGDVGSRVALGAGSTILLGLERNGQMVELTAMPRIVHPSDEGPLGVGIDIHLAPKAPLDAVRSGIQRTINAIVLLPGLIIEAAGSEQGLELAGPVGIVDIVGQAARQGPEILLLLAGFLATQLFLFNLMPWPALDGGRLVLIGLEAIRGKPLSAEREGAINFVGIALLLLLAVVVTVGDIRRLVSG